MKVYIQVSKDKSPMVYLCPYVKKISFSLLGNNNPIKERIKTFNKALITPSISFSKSLVSFILTWFCEEELSLAFFFFLSSVVRKKVSLKPSKSL